MWSLNTLTHIGQLQLFITAIKTFVVIYMSCIFHNWNIDLKDAGYKINFYLATL
jgi:hypothetical protein